LCTVWDIYGAKGGILLRFKLVWKLDILIFSTIYGRPNNSSRRERINCLKLGLKISQECAKIRDSDYLEEFWHKNFFLLSYFIYLFNVE
jgi:hypothetical protein